MTTIFYSWQSDLPSKINRGFIRDALDSAVRNVAKELSLDDAPRLDQDTAGIPGSPDIAASILQKIDSCSIFVPDLTLIGNEPVPNPNVLLEYGYALKSKGPNCIIAIMNDAFGSPESLPFDLRFRRWPIRYTLPKDASPEKRTEQKSKLISDLQDALTTAIKAGLLDRPQQMSEEIQAKWLRSSFLSDGDIIGEDQAKQILWFNGPQVFLRIIPLSPIQEISPIDLRDLIRRSEFSPFGDYLGGYWVVINAHGAATVTGKPNNQTIRALSLSQVFKIGEVWGIEQLPEQKPGTKYMPARRIEQTLIHTLQEYLRFSKDFLKLSTPLKYIVGISDILGYNIASDNGIVGEHSIEKEIVKSGTLPSYQIDPAQILTPFFSAIWESCGIRRPT